MEFVIGCYTILFIDRSLFQKMLLSVQIIWIIIILFGCYSRIIYVCWQQ